MPLHYYLVLYIIIYNYMLLNIIKYKNISLVYYPLNSWFMVYIHTRCII